MINLEKEIRQQGTVLAGVGAANSETVKAIAAAAKAHAIDQIVFAARGTSDHAAIYAQYLFHRYTGIPCSLATPSVVTKYGTHMHYEHALVIGISQSGCAQDVLSVLQDAKQSGAITATLTNNPDSPLAHGADFHLYCNAGPERSIAATKTFTSQMYALAMLCEAFCGDAEITEMLRRLPKMTEELMQTVPVQIEKIIARYRYLEDAFVLGRGMAYPIALEGALKILETNKIRVRGYASSDFHHGPMAQLSSKTLAIVLAPAGQTPPTPYSFINLQSKFSRHFLSRIILCPCCPATFPTFRITLLPCTRPPMRTVFSADSAPDAVQSVQFLPMHQIRRILHAVLAACAVLLSVPCPHARWIPLHSLP